MNQMINPAPIRRRIEVKANRAHCFDVFTRMTDWWPRTHSIGKAPLTEAIMEPGVGGRWYERGDDGSECTWGKVLAWEPPARLLLAWQINADWQHDPELTTEVEVIFTERAGGTTLVELEHRNLERFGEKATLVAASFDSEGGWPGILALYAQKAEA